MAFMKLNIASGVLAVLYVLSHPMPLTAQTSSDTVDVNGRTYGLSSALYGVGKEIYDNSPAANLYRQDLSFTEISASYSLRDESAALIVQEGDRFDAGNFNADSYIRLNDKSSAFANVEYVNGMKRNVLWNSSSDFLLLYPYVTADTVGGNLSHEKYMFSGGYSRKDGRFSYGVQASYRALHEYRRVDPRPRNITSDFNASISAGYSAGGSLVYVTVAGRIYRQISDVGFYNPTGANTSEIPMTGLGTYFERFTGTGAYLGTYHKGGGYSFRAGTVPKARRGWMAEVGFRSFTVRRLLSNQNDVPITSLNITDLSGYVGYRGDKWGIAFSGKHERRTGTEMIIDNGASNIYNVLGASLMYLNGIWDTAVSAFFDFEREKTLWTLTPVVGWLSSSAGYLFPERSMTYSRIYVRLPFMAVFGKSPWLFAVRAGASVAVNIGGGLDISSQEEEEAMSEMIRYGFSNLSASSSGGDCSLRAQRSLNRTMAVYMEGGCRYAYFTSGINMWMAEMKLGICF